MAELGGKSKKETAEKLIGRSISPAAKYSYEGHFAKLELPRSLNGISPYFSVGNSGKERGEDSLLSYLPLSVGPLNKDMSTMITHIHGIGHLRKLRLGANPIGEMPRAQLMVRGMRRDKGPTARKLLFFVYDLKTLKNLLDLDNADRQFVWCAVLLGWFFMLRMGEILVTPNPNMGEERHPLLMRDIEPLSTGARTRWGDHVDEVSIRIAGSKTDRPNQGCVRSHTQIPRGSPNSELCGESVGQTARGVPQQVLYGDGGSLRHLDEWFA